MRLPISPEMVCIGETTISTIETELPYQLHVHRAVGWYINEFDPDEGWDFRGIDGYGFREFQEFKREKTDEAFQNIKNKPALQNEFTDYIQECLEAFQQWQQNPNYLRDEYFSGKDFYFVLGSGRTGGTYLLNEVARAVDFPLKKSLIIFSHDTMPNMRFTSGEPTEERENREMFGMGWRDPFNYHNLVFQIIQYLVYIDRKFENEPKIVKKTQFGRCMKIVDFIFGDRASYIVTVRHPGACYRSWNESGFSTLEDSDKEKKREKILYGWESSYRNIVRDGLPEGSIEPVKYGPDMEAFLEKLFRKNSSNKEPSDFSVTEREYDDFWHSERVQSVISRVENSWSLHDLQFPTPEKIL